MNLFAYTGNNPTTFLDPKGEGSTAAYVAAAALIIHFIYVELQKDIREMRESMKPQRKPGPPTINPPPTIAPESKCEGSKCESSPLAAPQTHTHDEKEAEPLSDPGESGGEGPPAP